MVLNRIKHPQVRATSRSINNATIIKFGSYERSIQVKQCFLVCSQEVCARTRSRFRAFVHLSFKCFMCGSRAVAVISSTVFDSDIVFATTVIALLTS